jgi:hypothetical protein
LHELLLAIHQGIATQQGTRAARGRGGGDTLSDHGVAHRHRGIVCAVAEEAMIVTVVAKPKKDRRAYMRRWYEANKERCRENNRKKMAAWRENNPEKSRAAESRYNNSEKGIARRQRYIEKFPDAPYSAHRKSSLKKRYGITPEQWDAMFAAQKFSCANVGCGIQDPGDWGWHTDHCHATGRLRGILCRSCNHALGMVRDKPHALRGLADYIEQYSDMTDRPAECLTVPHGWKKKSERKRVAASC